MTVETNPNPALKNPARGFLNFGTYIPSRIGANTLEIKIEAIKPKGPAFDQNEIAMAKPKTQDNNMP